MATSKPLPKGGKITFFTSEVKSALGLKEERFVRTATQMIEDRVKTLMVGTPRTGRVYRIGKTPTRADRKAGRTFRSHTASSPGNPPAPRSGGAGLLGRINSIVLPKLGVGWEGRVGANYWTKGHKWSIPKLLEFGTKHMKPRPMWFRALKEVWPKVVAMFKGKK